MKKLSMLSLSTATVLMLAAMALAIWPISAPAAVVQVADPQNPQVVRGGYLVKIMGCNDCHTPWKVGPKGPEPDMTRMLSGHPQDLAMPTIKLPDAPWSSVTAGTNTAFAGPWGVSFTANLTPDPETGLGKWTGETFIQALRTGRHEGQGRPILPPMPYPMYRNATDDDLRAVFAFLQSIPPIRNRVPQPIDPPETE